MNKRWGELANKMGTVVEDIVAPSIRRLAREVFDCGELRQFWTRMSASRSDDPSRTREFDALYVGTRAVLLNETKSSPRASDARRFAAFLESGELGCYFPQYRKLPIVAAFSSLSIPDDLVTWLTRRGIYAIAMGDEAMQMLNLPRFHSPCCLRVELEPRKMAHTITVPGPAALRSRWPTDRSRRSAARRNSRRPLSARLLPQLRGRSGAAPGRPDQGPCRCGRRAGGLSGLSSGRDRITATGIMVSRPPPRTPSRCASGG